MSIGFLKSIYSDCSKDVLNFVEECFLDFYIRDKETADIWLSALCQMKIAHPEFKIEFSGSSNKSFYSCRENKIIISSKSFFDDRTFLHEMAHALYFNKYGTKRPKNFDTIIENIRTDQDRLHNILSLVPFCREHLLELESKRSMISKICNDISKDKNEKGTSDKKYDCLVALEDIIDAILKGSAYERGVVISKDDNHSCTKLGKFSGHGEEYFSAEDSVFNEILANYFSIAAIDKKFLELVDSILGEELVDLLNRLYENLFCCLKKEEIIENGIKNTKK